MSEILAPAGDKNSALAAVNAGADAIYLGLKSFSARSSAENFDFEEFEEISSYCRAFGVKVYVAMNTLVKNSELDDFIKTAVEVWNRGADALIISDIFLGKFIKRHYPDIVLHLSTQAGVCNRYGAQLAKEYGFTRVILARETSLEDIKEITKIIETEVFIQGALCTCFSGQCYLSSFAGGNSGNRGKCKQPCRKKYSIDRTGFEESAYWLSLSDLSVGESIDNLIDAGVFSFKIEGRMRRPEYVSAAVKYYRNLLDGQSGEGALSALKRTYNRGNYTKGLAFGQDKSFISSAVQGHIGEFIGTVKVENGKYICHSTLKFNSGDGFKILREGKEVCGANYSGAVKDGFILSTKTRLKNGDKVFITTDSALNCELLSYRLTVQIEIDAKFLVGKKAEITVNGHIYGGQCVLESAQTRSLSVEDIKNTFKKVDKYPFSVKFRNIETDGVFLRISDLNELRRTVYAEYFKSISQNKNVRYEVNHVLPAVGKSSCNKTAVICTNLCGVETDIGILKLNDINADILPLIKGFKGEKFLYLPPYLTASEIEQFKRIIPSFEGIYCGGNQIFKLCEEFNKPLFVGCGMNVSNAVDLAECNAKYIALSKELTTAETSEIECENTFCLTAGDLKVMDLIYCPFEKKCSSCDKRDLYTLTDENGRKFPLRRYKTSACRFELYNCASLVASTNTGILVDCTLQKCPQKLLNICKDGEKLKKYFESYTKGHSVQPIN